MEEYHARGEKEDARERHFSRDAGAHPPTGKEHIADAPQKQPTANGATNDSGPSPKDLEMKEDHAEGVMSEAVSGETVVEPEQQSTLTSHEASADTEEASKEMLDDNGEEVVEAAEDTVIY